MISVCATNHFGVVHYTNQKWEDFMFLPLLRSVKKKFFERDSDL